MNGSLLLSINFLNSREETIMADTSLFSVKLPTSVLQDMKESGLAFEELCQKFILETLKNHLQEENVRLCQSFGKRAYKRHMGRE